MANRQILVKGYGYGAEPASITVTANGTQVFSGEVTTLNQPIPALPAGNLITSTANLCSFEIDRAFSGSIPMSITVSGSPVMFAQIIGNYANILNTTGTGNLYISSGPTDFRETNLLLSTPGEVDDSRSNVVIDGVAQIVTEEQRGGMDGTWWWVINPGSTFSYDLAVIAGKNPD